jgi:hypothetical protein
MPARATVVEQQDGKTCQWTDSAAELNPAVGLNWSTELSTRAKKMKKY